MFDGRFRRGVDKGVAPFGRAMASTGLSPNHLTALGVVLAVPSAVAIGAGHLHLGLALLVASAVPDLLDGALAKASGRASVRGAFLDSVSDRVSDSVVLGGVAWYLASRYGAHAALLAMGVLAVSLLVSYERAKAESLGFEAKGGVMERAERVVVLCAGLAFGSVLVPLLWAMLALTSATALQRFVKVWRQASVPATTTPTTTATTTATISATTTNTATTAQPPPAPAPVAERWRAWRESTGWVPRSEREPGSLRRGRAAERWRERRSASSRRRRTAPDGRRGGGRP